MRTITAVLAFATHLLLQAQGPGSEALAQARTAYDAADLQQARTYVDQAISAEPQLAAAYKLRGDILQRERAFEEAMADYNKAEDLDPKDVRLFVSRSALRLSMGNYRAAVRDADRAIFLAPTADAFSNKGWALYLSGEPDAALKEANRTLRMDGQHPEALYLAGLVKGERGSTAEGLQNVQDALRLRPDLPGGAMSMAVLYYENKDYEKAIELFEKALAADSADAAAALYYKGHAYHEMKDKDNACSAFRASMALGDRDSGFAVRNYCNNDLKRIPKKPKRGTRKTTIEF